MGPDEKFLAHREEAAINYDPPLGSEEDSFFAILRDGMLKSFFLTFTENRG